MMKLRQQEVGEPMVARTGAGWTAVLVLVGLSTSCLPSDPETPVGVRLAEGGDISGLEIIYLACADERVTEFALERSTTRAFDEAGVIWSVAADGEGVEAQGEERIDVPIGEVPEPFEVRTTLSEEAAEAEDWLAVSVTSDEFGRQHSTLFTVDRLDQDRIFINGRFFTDDEFVERYSCEHHRGRLW